MDLHQLPMSIMAGREMSITYSGRAGSVTLRFTVTAQELRASWGDFDNALKWLGPKALLSYTKQVQMIIKPREKKRQQISARFAVADAVAVLDEQWPAEENFGRIVKAIKTKKGDPDPNDEIPWKTEKSLTAQGQNRKPGSHRDNRGHN